MKPSRIHVIADDASHPDAPRRRAAMTSSLLHDFASTMHALSAITLHGTEVSASRPRWSTPALTASAARRGSPGGSPGERRLVELVDVALECRHALAAGEREQLVHALEVIRFLRTFFSSVASSVWITRCFLRPGVHGARAVARRPGPGSDVYELGVLLHNSGSLPERMTAHCEQRPVRPAMVSSDLASSVR